MKTKRMAIVPTAILSLLAASNLSAATHYVSCRSANPTPPYTHWTTAALTLQDAVDAAAPGDVILVTNGVYATGSRSLSLLNTNVSPPKMMTVWSSRVVVTNAVRLESVNGPGVTVVDGCLMVNGDGVVTAGVRCVYLGQGAVLSGFTLTNGMAGPLGSPQGRDATGNGGGVLAAPSAVVTNCVIAGNLAQGGGSGVCGGTLYHCVLTNNPGKWTTGIGGAYRSHGVGGGALESTLYHCLLAGNSSTGDGGGGRKCVFHDCDLIGNRADYSGGGASESVLNDCRLTGNSADEFYGGGGAAFSFLTNCILAANSSTRGGGAFGSTLVRCVLRDNRGEKGGGGAYGSALYSCALIRNSAQYGGGAASSSLTHCTLTANLASWVDLARWLGPAGGGGAYQCTLTNSIVFGNQSPVGAENCDPTTSLSYCCTTPLPTNGLGNMAVNPQFASLAHLSATSPCLRAGSMACAVGTDIDGEPWADPPAIGCDEHPFTGVRGPLAVTIEAVFTNVMVGYPVSLTALVDGPTRQTVWDFADGGRATNQPMVTHAWSASGEYRVTLWAFNEDHPDGVSASLTLRVDNGAHYVDAGSTHPVPPYTSWATAASNIQDAVDVSGPGTLILVTNGIYATGGRRVAGALTNRVTLDRPLRLLSVNGPEFTIIDGGGAVRCVSLFEGSLLSGFTLTHGRADRGAGVFLGARFWSLLGGWTLGPSKSAVVSNCWITANEASSGDGGGACGGTLYNCILKDNRAQGADRGNGGGAYSSTLYNCTLTANRAEGADDAAGGGACSSILNNCALSGNSATWAGGGASSCYLTNCTLTNNSAPNGGGTRLGTLNRCTLIGNSAVGLDGHGQGGGASGSILTHCILTRNSAASGGGGAVSSTLNNCTVVGNNSTSYGGGGVLAGTLYNCILYFNTPANSKDSDTEGSFLYNCCTTPLPIYAVGCITNNPSFVDYPQGDLGLQSNSPCINVGSNACVTTTMDLAGNERIAGGTVDLGAYEFQGEGLSGFTAWLWRYGQPIDGSAHATDPDHDHLNNWQEWVCTTCPTNSQSALRLLSPIRVGTNVRVTWSSVAGVNYCLERTANLASPFSLLAKDLVGQAGFTTYEDTHHVGVGPCFYRVGVTLKP